MADRVENELGLKITNFQAALKNASHLMREFGERARETGKHAGEQLRDIAKDTGGLAAAVTAFGAAVVETFSKATAASEDFEASAMQIGLLVGNMKKGDEIERSATSVVRVRLLVAG